jgi:hypothetical protein
MGMLIHDFGTIRPPGCSIWEEPWPPERIQGDPPKSLPAEPHFPEEVVLEASQSSAQAQLLPTLAPGTPSTAGEHEAGHLALTTLEQAIATYVQEMRVSGRDPKTLQWHQTSLGALRRYLWRQFHLTGTGSLTRASLQTWVTELSVVPSVRTGATRTVNTVAAYARSAHAFCNWLVRQGVVAHLSRMARSRL